MEKQMNLKAKFLGGMVGSALGDAIGEMAFSGLGEAALRASISQTGKLIYTDDTAMAIGLAESLIARGRVDEQHLGDTFKANFDREPWRGYASGPPTIFKWVETEGITYTAAARKLFDGSGSYGNGAAMRIAPLGLFYHAAPDIYEPARASAVVTHAHPIGIDGAAVLAAAVARAVRLDPQDEFPFERFSQALIDRAATPEIAEKMRLVQKLVAENIAPSEATRYLGRGVAVHESMPFAVYSFLRHSQSFEECLFCAILNGGDRDTLGAMAGAVSGAYLGIAAIPPEWRERLENREYIEELAVRLQGDRG